MKKLNSFLESHLLPLAIKIGANKYLGIIRDAMCANLALLIIGSLSILLANIPNDTIASFIAPANPLLNGVFAIATGIMGLATAAGIAYYASKEFKLVSYTTITISIASFLLTQLNLDGTLNMAGLGAEGLMTAIIVSFTTAFIIKLCKEKNITIKLPEGVPPSIADSFSALIPGACSIILFGIISVVFKFNINQMMASIFSPLSNILNTLPGYMIYHMLCGLVFFCGIHNNVITGVVLPFMLVNGAANEAALAAGKSASFVAVQSTDAIVMMGGTGATLGIVLLMSFLAKSQFFKKLGKVSFLPAVFNINEPVIFGLPICFNPLFFIPFVITPGIIAGLTYILMTSGVIGMPVIANLPWSTPFFAAGFLICGGNVLGTIWPVIVIIISLLIYYPFFKIADKMEYQKELDAKNDNLVIEN